MHDITSIIITVLIIASVTFIALMAILSRMAGGGLGAVWLEKYGFKFLPELIFALPFGLPIFFITENWILYIICTIWSYLWMQTGHGSVLNWGQNPDYTKARKQFLSPLIDKISNALNIKIGSTNYARLFMAVKGFLIGLPVGGVVLAILWPLGYEIGNRLKKHEISEFASGAGAGVAIILFSFLLVGIIL